MKFNIYKYFAILLLGLILSACEEESPDLSLELLGANINGIPLVDGTINVNQTVSLQFTFSKALNANSFESAFSLRSNQGLVNGLSFSYTSASSTVTVEANLEAKTVYTVSLSTVPIGQNQEILNQSINLSFTTVEGGGIITELPPCLSASNDCFRSLSVNNTAGASGNFDFYSTYPLDLDNARWEKLSRAVIVVHGQNRNADDYFNYMTTSLRQENLENETIIIAPFFKAPNDAQTGDLSWSSSDWREGQNSDSNAQISSFTVLDQILAILGDTTHFPVLEKILITGHSSGGLYTHAYAAANISEPQYAHLDFRYVVANSQYFYYPEDLRFDSSTGQYIAVTNCARYNNWPLGFVNPPPYLSGVNEAQIDQQIIERKVTYLLGTNDVVTTGTLNTNDCEAVLLGENRFLRGQYIFNFIKDNYPSSPAERVDVDGVGHNAQSMYQSAAFKTWLNSN